ncbi:MAG: hypothetical protein GXY83_16795 [Rhodopirellula sp.]|mgnify:CR=1 FL=1|nr:hypothetical protein [Rhodopirellula sp.]
MRARRGYSLIETLAAMTLVTTTFTAVAVSLHQMYRSTRSVQDELSMELELGRFAIQFRADAHQALSVEMEDSVKTKTDSQTLSLVLPDERTVHYVLQPRRIDRTVRRGAEARHRETYRLPRWFAPRWQLEPERPPAIVSLLLAPRPAVSGSPPVVAVRVDAAVGLLRSQSRLTQE